MTLGCNSIPLLNRVVNYATQKKNKNAIKTQNTMKSERWREIYTEHVP